MQGWQVVSSVNLEELPDDECLILQNDEKVYTSDSRDAEKVVTASSFIPDDDLTVIMRHVVKKKATSYQRSIPKENQGARRGNLMALRFGNSSTTMTAVGRKEKEEEYEV
ncbi:MAG: hypothetical protein LBQ41_01570 [Candidatus Ancillula sp.]|jgi:hypothetical protein|nr:hypothetical protein [Candidatus Ancillula sp.]